MGKFVRGSDRREVPRPQPPHDDRRLKRSRTRADQEREAIADHLHYEDDPDSCTELCEDGQVTLDQPVQGPGGRV